MGIDGAVGRLPVFAVVLAPLAPEAFRVPAANPELGFLEVNGLGAGVEGALDADAQEPAEARPRAHIIDIAAVTDLVAVAIGLGFVLVVDAIEPAVEVVLVIAPGYARHDVDAVAAVAPRLDPLGQAGVDAVDDGHIRAQVAAAAPALAGLEAGALEVLLRVGGKRRRELGGGSEGRDHRDPGRKHGGEVVPGGGAVRSLLFSCVAAHARESNHGGTG